MITLTYPFQTSMREICKFLDKRSIDNAVEPILLQENEHGKTTVTFDTTKVINNISFPGDTGDNSISMLTYHLRRLFGNDINSRPYSQNDLIVLPDLSNQTEFDALIWNKIGNQTLVEKHVGRYWNFVFDKNHILTQLIVKSGRFGEADEVYYRTQTSLRQQASTNHMSLVKDHPLVFICPTSKWECKVIWLGCICDPSKRLDEVILTGLFVDYMEKYRMEMIDTEINSGKKNEIKYVFDRISWKIKDTQI